jgi:hypothetical protein
MVKCSGSIELGEGTRNAVDVAADSATGDGVNATIVDGKVIVHAPYGSGGTHAVSLTCGQQTGKIDVSVRAIAWAPVAKWSGAKKEGPLGREYFAMWIDEGDPDRLLLFGGFHYVPMQFTPAWDLWQYNLANNTWTEITPKNEPPHYPGGRAAPIPGSRSILYLGGLDGNNTPRSLVRFDYDTITWSDMPGSANAPGSYTGSFVYDAPRKRWVSACGASNQEFSCKPWQYTVGRGWERLAYAGTLPIKRTGFFYAYDEPNQRLIIFSGDTDGTSWMGKMDQKTYALELDKDPAEWVELLGPQDPPTGRRNGAYAYDPIGHRMFTWGGTPDGQSTLPGLYALDLDRGHEAWSKVDVPSPPPERTSGMGVYDAKRHRILFGFGNNPAPYEDLWALQL